MKRLSELPAHGEQRSDPSLEAARLLRFQRVVCRRLCLAQCASCHANSFGVLSLTNKCLTFEDVLEITGVAAVQEGTRYVFTLKGSVGEGGKNAPEEVILIKSLLNQYLGSVPYNPLPLGGTTDDKLKQAIRNFQKRVVGLKNPDGRVDPGGRTLRHLAKQVKSVVKFELMPSSGKGFYTYDSASARWGRSHVIAALKKVAADFDARFSGVPIGIGHISKEAGGKLNPHKSHRKGLDVDVRPLRTDGKKLPVTISSGQYSRDRTKYLVELLRKQDRLKSILFNDTQISGVVSYPGHHNHLHVSFKP